MLKRREDATSVRLDSWLWAARFYKTRTLAAEAVDGGKVDLNGDRPKRSRAVKVGDEIALRQGPYHYRLTVTGLADRRGPASVAATLYQEDAASLAARQALSEKLKFQAPTFFDGTGRPTKKQRRDLDKLKRRN